MDPRPERRNSSRPSRARLLRSREAASPPPGTYRLLPPRSDRASILMRRRHSFVTTVTSASPAFPMLAPAAWKSARALRFSFALRCVALRRRFPCLHVQHG
ncbi:hypothetical protein K523DRAFT_3015 [Schizophyllum commune Tattone D]|nr:hypothetical protein K523DRAFT_3015 [Schizophyllum commune Tattone D]